LRTSLDEEHYDILAEVVSRCGAPMESVVHQVVNGLAEEHTRQAAGARLLAAEPMPVADWETLKAELSEAATTGRLWAGRD